MMIKHYIHKALTMPPHVTVRKVAGKIMRTAYEAFLRRKDYKVSSYVVEYPEGKLFSCFPGLAIEQLLRHAESISGVTKHYLDHRFDLLGSGWVKIVHDMRCRGLEGYRYDMGSSIKADPEGKWLEGRINPVNLEESKSIWKLIYHDHSKTGNQKIKTYTPIDWHLDFKSGYRWSESTWYKDIRYGHNIGVDVKVPWELARMQHLPQLAIAYALAVQSSPEKWPSDFTGQAKHKDKSNEQEKGTEYKNQQSINGQMEQPERYAWEFRRQVLDFIATNPPRFGVNWACTMDVGIRVSNWLAAYDMFCACGAQFDQEFLEVFRRSVYEHGLHIVNNLECNEEYRSNHYLSNIAGLLFVAACLPCSPEIDAWLAFTVQELITEVENQFYHDGGNFEASTSYHRLSAEMTLYATAMVLALPDEKVNALRDYNHTLINIKPSLKRSPLSFCSIPIKKGSKLKAKSSKSTSPFPEWYFERLEKIAEFTMHITKPNCHIPQIGDNDSGRFFKLQSTHKKMTVAQAKKRYLNLEGYEELPDNAIYLDEDFLDHRHLVASINGLFDRDDFTAFVGDEWLETDLIRNITDGITISSYKKVGEPTAAEKVRIGSDNKWDELCSELEATPEEQKKAINIPLPDGAAVGLKLYAYPDFGFYIYRSKRFYLAIRCGSIGQNGNGGHAHNDQLSIELNINGKDIIADPGTYLYTPLPERRNEYRSVKAHFAPQVKGREPGNLDEGLFKLVDAVSGECLYFGEEGFVGRHYGYSSKIWLHIKFQECKLKISHIYTYPIQKFMEIPWMSCNFKNINAVYNYEKHSPLNNFCSPSYGKRIALSLDHFSVDEPKHD